MFSLQCDTLKTKVSSLDSQMEKISGQLKTEEAKSRELENKLKIKENEWKIDKAALEEKAKVKFYYSTKLRKDTKKYCNSLLMNIRPIILIIISLH